jgi:KaiC/GvpD/RAD55 family RecA-like ATPase
VAAVLDDAALDALVAGAPVPPPVGGGGGGGRFEHYRPLEQAVDEFVHSARTRDSRILTGIPEFDAAMRGLGKKELMVVQGFAHSGKTLFITQMLFQNHEKRIVMFTPDEDRVLVLVKLASLLTGVSAERLEDLIYQDHPTGIELVRQTVEFFPHLGVFDDVASYEAMHRATDEYSRAHGGEPDMVVFDYADLFQGGDDESGTPGKINRVKAWGKDRDVAMALLHQSSRTAGAGGRKVKIDSGAYGGEQQATFVVGVRRRRYELMERRDDLQEKLHTTRERDKVLYQLRKVQDELDAYWNTITFNLVKNKRPPSRLVDELDFELDADSGQLKPFNGHYVAPRPEPARQPQMVSMSEAMAQVGGIQNVPFQGEGFQ